MNRLALPATALFLAAACQKAETPEQLQARMVAESDSARAYIEQAAARFGQYFSALQADSVATLFADDARLMVPNMPLVAGRDSIRAAFTGMFTQGQFALTLRVENVSASGPVAVERGSYTFQFTPGPGVTAPAEADTGKYLVHRHRHDGTWLIVDDIWNSDRPAPPPPPRR